MSKKGVYYLLIALLTYAFTHITDKLAVQAGVAPSILAFFSVFTGLLLIAAVWISHRQINHLVFNKIHLKELIIIGSLTSGLGVLLGVMALTYTTATNRGVMQGMYTAFTLVTAHFLLRERLPKLFYPIFIGMLIGLVLLTSKGFIQYPNRGDWFLFATLPIIGFCNAYAKKTMGKMPSLTVTFGRYIFGSLFLFLVLPFFPTKDILSIGNGIHWVLISGILGAVRVMTFYKGIELEGPTLAATMLSISPAITAVSAYFILGEQLNMLQMAGLTLILIGALSLTKLKAVYLK